MFEFALHFFGRAIDFFCLSYSVCPAGYRDNPTIQTANDFLFFFLFFLLFNSTESISIAVFLLWGALLT